MKKRQHVARAEAIFSLLIVSVIIPAACLSPPFLHTVGCVFRIEWMISIILLYTDLLCPGVVWVVQYKKGHKLDEQPTGQMPTCTNLYQQLAGSTLSRIFFFLPCFDKVLSSGV